MLQFGHRRVVCAALLCLSASSLLARNFYIIPSDTTISSIATATSDPLGAQATVPTAGVTARVIASTTANKHYALTSAPEAVLVLQNFPRPTIARRIFLGGAATGGVLSGDGSKLVVFGPGGVGLIDTATDIAVVQLTRGFDVGGEPTDVAASHDGSRAYVVSRGASRLSVISLAGSGSVVGSTSLSGPPEAVTVGPNGLIFVSVPNSVLALDPVTLGVRFTIPVNGTPGKLQFTASGNFAVAVSAAAGGGGVYLLDVERRSGADLNSLNLAFTDVALISETQAYAVTNSGILYALTIDPGGTLGAARATIEGGLTGNVTEVAASGELPQSRNLLVIADSVLYKVDTTTNTVVGNINIPYPGRLEQVDTVQTGTPARVFSYNTTQIFPSGTASQPLTVRVVDAAGLPLSGVAVTFAAPSGISLGATTVTTNNQGFASTTATLPSGLATAVTVSATVPGQPAVTFTLTPGTAQQPGFGNLLTRVGLTIVAGQGQVLAAGAIQAALSGEPLRVRLTDRNGSPVQDADIRWERVSGIGGDVGGLTSRTDANGEAFMNFISTGNRLLGTTEVTVVAAIAPDGQRREFLITTTPAQTAQRPAGFLAQWLTDNSTIIDVRAGETTPGAIRAIVLRNGSGERMPNVGMRIVNTNNSDPSAGPYVECQNVYALSNSQGELSCDLVAGPRTTDAAGLTSGIQVTALIGSTERRTYTIRVLQGSPANIRITSNPSPSGNPGQALSPLQIEVTDAAGNLLSNVPLTWEIPFFFPAATSIQRATDINGRASAALILPNDRTGTFQVRVSAGNAAAVFNITVNAIAGNISATQGANQTALVSTAFGQALQVRVTDSSGRPLQGAPVSFAVTSGSASVTPTSTTTNAEGLASANVTAGATAGPVVITATSGAASVTFNLTARLAGPVFTAADILNAAGFSPGVSPGSIAYIRASGIAPNLRGSTTANIVVGPLPTRLADVEVLFNNIPAPIYAVSNVRNEESVVVQVPFEVIPGRANVTVRTASGGTTTIENVEILPVKPGVFTWTDTNGATYAVATRPDGSYISASNPARRGENIRVFATGLGQTSPGTATNRTGVAGQAVSAAIIGGINNAGTRVVSAELVPGSIGVYVVTLEIPADTSTGNSQPIGLGVAGVDGNPVFANATYIPIV